MIGAGRPYDQDWAGVWNQDYATEYPPFPIDYWRRQQADRMDDALEAVKMPDDPLWLKGEDCALIRFAAELPRDSQIAADAYTAFTTNHPEGDDTP